MARDSETWRLESTYRWLDGQADEAWTRQGLWLYCAKAMFPKWLICTKWCWFDLQLNNKNIYTLYKIKNFWIHFTKNYHKIYFYCVNTSYPMDNMLNRSAQTGPPNVRKRRPVFPPAGRSIVLCTPQMAPRTSFLSRQPDVIASFSFGACTVQTCFQHLQNFKGKVCIMTDFQPFMWIYSV